MSPDRNILDKSGYEIGAVSKITGISAHRLRIWERRYSLVNPKRSENGRRSYSNEDLRKLLLIRSLLDVGYSIGSLSNLSTDQLEDRLTTDPKLETFKKKTRESYSLKTAVFGSNVLSRIKVEENNLKYFDFKFLESDYEKFTKKILNEELDLIIFEFETIDTKVIQEIYNLVNLTAVKHAILIYWFGEYRVIKNIDKSVITALRAPIEPDELQVICNNLYELNIENYFNEFQAERIFDLRELARIVSSETPIKCEYPQQLATLIYSLNAFEKYCRECDNKYLEDAKFHKFLHQTTSQARSLIENALKKVIEMEGIEY